MRAKIAAGNWKMNGARAALSELEALAPHVPDAGTCVVICPPAHLLFAAATSGKAHGIAIGAQDCHMQNGGAFTGDLSASMIAETGAAYVIVGHSERREAHGETNADVAAKAEQAWAAGLTPIICIGESLAEREGGTTLDVLGDQLKGSLPAGMGATNTVIAYEPIWAIGTGKVPTQAQIITVHDFIRAHLETHFDAEIAGLTPLLYGGSVKADNAATIFKAENVDGALVGGASLKASDFGPIVAALAAS